MKTLRANFKLAGEFEKFGNQLADHAETMQKLIKGVMDKRNIHLLKWIKKHMEIIGVDINDDQFKEIMARPDSEELLKRIYGFEYIMRTIDAANNTEQHKIFVNGKQIGTTLLIKHEFISGRKVKLIINEELAPFPE